MSAVAVDEVFPVTVVLVFMDTNVVVKGVNGCVVADIILVVSASVVSDLSVAFAVVVAVVVVTVCVGANVVDRDVIPGLTATDVAAVTVADVVTALDSSSFSS